MHRMQGEGGKLIGFDRTGKLPNTTMRDFAAACCMLQGDDMCVIPGD
jgi:hypothetical protein